MDICIWTEKSEKWEQSMSTITGKFPEIARCRPMLPWPHPYPTSYDTIWVYRFPRKGPCQRHGWRVWPWSVFRSLYCRGVATTTLLGQWEYHLLAMSHQLSWDVDAGSNDVAKLHISHMQTSGNMLELIQMLSALHRSERWANANGWPV